MTGGKRVTTGRTRRETLRQVAVAGLGGAVISAAGLAVSAQPAAADNQGSWRWCNRCQSLFYGAAGTAGACPAGGGGHNSSGSFTYFIPYAPIYKTEVALFQHGWRWCRRCQSMFYGVGAVSRCALGGAHDGVGSADYVLDRVRGGQGGWRWCWRCQGLYYGPNNAVSRCPVGGRHGLRSSWDYNLPTDGQPT